MPQYLNELDRVFVQNYDEGKGDFWQKLQGQLASSRLARIGHSLAFFGLPSAEPFDTSVNAADWLRSIAAVKVCDLSSHLATAPH